MACTWPDSKLISSLVFLGQNPCKDTDGGLFCCICCQLTALHSLETPLKQFREKEKKKEKKEKQKIHIKYCYFSHFNCIKNQVIGCFPRNYNREGNYIKTVFCYMDSLCPNLLTLFFFFSAFAFPLSLSNFLGLAVQQLLGHCSVSFFCTSVNNQ